MKPELCIALASILTTEGLSFLFSPHPNHETVLHSLTGGFLPHLNLSGKAFTWIPIGVYFKYIPNIDDED